MEETPITLPPEPEETGVRPEQRTPTQEETRALVPTVEGKDGASHALSERLGAIGESGIRGYAGVVLLQANVAHLEGEIRQLRSERDAAVQKAERYKDQYHEQKERAAVFEAERDAGKTVTRLRKVLITAGGIIVSFGLRGFFETQQPVWTWPATIAGCAILLAGWFLPDRRSPKG
jgi:hypothetical protein